MNRINPSSRASVLEAPSSRGAPVEAASKPLLPGIGVFLPCRNEEDNVERVVMGFVAAISRVARDYEVVVVNDGSRDRTGEVAERLAAADPRVKVVHHAVNRGYGAAVTSGVRAATSPYVVLCDGDGQFNPADLSILAAHVPDYDVVVGIRAPRVDPLMRRIKGRAWTGLVRALFGIRIHDIDCGFKLFKREFLDNLPLQAQGAMISTELMVRVAGRGARILEVDVPHLPRIAGQASGANYRVIMRAFRELFRLYRELKAESRRGR